MEVGIDGNDGKLMLDKLGTLGLKFLTAATALTGAAVIPAYKIIKNMILLLFILQNPISIYHALYTQKLTSDFSSLFWASI